MLKPPRLAALRRGLGDGQEIALREDVLPDRLFLRRAEKQRQGVAIARVQRLLPQPLDEGAEGQDVGRFPHREALLRLEGVEMRHQRLRKAPVGRYYGDAGGVPFCEAREEIGLRKHSAPQFS